MGLASPVPATQNAGPKGTEDTSVASGPIPELDREVLAVRQRLVRRLLEVGRKAEAVPHLRAIAEGDPDTGSHWSRLRKILTELDDAEGEVAVLERQLELGQSSPAIGERLMRLLRQLGRHEQVLAQLQAVAEAEPQQAEHWRKLARAVSESGDPDAEIAFLSRRLELAAPDPATRTRLIRLLTQQDRKAELIVQLRALAESEPGDPRHWNRLSRAMSDAGDTDGEVDALEKRLQLGGEDVATRGRLVRLLNQLGRPADTIPHLRAMAEAEPEEASHWNRLTRALAAAGDVEGEIEVLQRMLELEHA